MLDRLVEQAIEHDELSVHLSWTVSPLNDVM